MGLVTCSGHNEVHDDGDTASTFGTVWFFFCLFLFAAQLPLPHSGNCVGAVRDTSHLEPRTHTPHPTPHPPPPIPRIHISVTLSTATPYVLTALPTVGEKDYPIPDYPRNPMKFRWVVCGHRSYLTESVYQVVLLKSISAQIRQLIFYYY